MLKLTKKVINKLFKNNVSFEPDARDKYLESIECSYLFSIFSLFKEVENVPGHIIELGVGAGRNSILLGNLLKTTNQHGNAKYYGFDSFGSYTQKDLDENSGLSKKKWERNSYEFVKNRISNFDLNNVCKFIKGDIRDTLPKFISDNEERHSAGTFFCRFVYIDTSAYTPAKIGLNTLYKHLSKGGIIAIDQRRQGGEWEAFFEFCSENSLEPISGRYFNDVPAYIFKK